MAEKVKMQLAEPDKVVKEGSFSGVVLPAYAGNLTVIPGRAPSIIWLNPGVVRLLNADSEAEEKYFVGNGVAEVADDFCKISVEHIIAFKSITPAEAEKLIPEAENKDIAAFYQMIRDYLTAFPAG